MRVLLLVFDVLSELSGSTVPNVKAAKDQSRFKKTLYTGLGLLFSGFAIAGVVLPLMPVTINVIVAGFFFAMGSERFDSWLTGHKVFGPIITDYRSGAGFTVRGKTIAVTAMSTSILLSTIYALTNGAPTMVAYAMTAIWAYAAWFILKQPTKGTPRLIAKP
ncbi:MAG: YbaN family protein [Acidimicrobiia bacterium]|nr:YbaN family protein [Acidimicrobiia bacterium]MDH5420607.1 YbaN family protein [Acidimicrobiia bacterium]MDH5503983.1 YbaN family protein [Acidimicrobiia bacterium]